MDLARPLAELMQRRFGGDLGSPNRRDSGDDVLWIPSIDASARGDDLVIRAELPGIDPQRDLEISVEDGVLTIRGERREQRREERDRAIRTETIYGSFLRTVP